MYRVLLVDDEYLELEMLEKYVLWEDMGFEVIAAVTNGREALEKVEALRPDVIITDIRMPFMDGITFAKMVYELHRDIRIVFLSGHSQFDYAKAAIKIGAIDYLLKPIEIKELQILMQSLKKILDQEKETRNMKKSLIAENFRKSFTGMDIASEPDKIKELCEICNRYFDCEMENQQFYLSLITIDELQYLSENREIFDFSVEDIKALLNALALRADAMIFASGQMDYLFLTVKDVSKIIDLWKKENTDIQEFVSIFSLDKALEMENLTKEYQKLLELRGWYVKKYGSGQLKTAAEAEEMRDLALHQEESIPCRSKLEALVQAMLKGEEEEVKDWFAVFYAHEFAGENMHTQTIELLDHVYAALSPAPKGSEKKKKDKLGLYRRLLGIESIPLLRNFTETHILQLMQDLTNVNGDAYQNVMQGICQYIEEHFHEQFTIDSLGELFNYSPNYIRYIFKKNNGCTILEYITDVRMRRAAQMLLETPIKIRVISDKVGYSNPSYFCAQFLKKYGITPQQYRSKVVK